MNSNYDYSYEWDQRYCYPHSKVLINKLGIKDEEKLRIAEREITSLRIANALHSCAIIRKWTRFSRR